MIVRLVSTPAGRLCGMGRPDARTGPSSLWAVPRRMSTGVVDGYAMSSAVEGYPETASVLLYWLPLGAGGHSVRWNGRVFEAIVARHERRAVQDLYHAALEIHLGADRFVVEMGPAWGAEAADRGVVLEGPVGLRWLGRSAFFRYEVRRWRMGVITDVAEAVASPQRVSQDVVRARRLLELVPQVPAVTWGRDELQTGEMWNSNSLIAWLLASSDHGVGPLGPPLHGRAPGWRAGLVLAARQAKPAAAAVGSGA